MAGRETLALLKRACISEDDLAVFVSETISELVQSGEEVSSDYVETLLADAGLEVDEDDLEELCAAV